MVVTGSASVRSRSRARSLQVVRVRNDEPVAERQHLIDRSLMAKLAEPMGRRCSNPAAIPALSSLGFSREELLRAQA